ncbi:MAG: hemerythrin domain-containing protein [Syntrophobacterales bacterium]|jgi:hemerythrin-like domain-containing protein
MDDNANTRRAFLCKGGMLLSLAVALGPTALLAQTGKPPQKETEAQAPGISPVEDLMREHGVLRRILLVYAEIIRRLQTGLDFPMKTLSAAAGLIHDFVEDYHEKLEEQHVFPQFERAGQMVPLVKVLRRQHQAGRQITRYLQTQAAVGILLNEQNRQELSKYLGSFIRMYQPHAAREDTVLFPAFRFLMPAKPYQELGEQFEELEEQKFGRHGFANVVVQVGELEKSLEIFDLAQFTPHLTG